MRGVSWLPSKLSCTWATSQEYISSISSTRLAKASRSNRLKLKAPRTDARVQIGAAKEPLAGPVEHIVHHRVKAVPGQPLLGRMPDFTNQVGLRIDRP